MLFDTDVRLGDGDHVVQFYDSVADLVGVAVGYFAGALLEGETVIVIAGLSHREAFDTALVAAGIDVEAAHRQGRLLALDAAEMLDRVMTDGSLDAHRFDVVIGGLVREAAAERPVRLYGEMVGLLWDAGDVALAIELEELWNGLAAQEPFSLYCAYASTTSDVNDSNALANVCGLHSAVIAAAPTPGESEVGRRFVRSLREPRAARRFVADTLRGWGLGDLVDDAEVVVSELATNAVVHASSDFAVGLSRHAGGVRLVVSDASVVAPLQRTVDPTIPGAHGLRLVGALSSGWGHEVVDGGKMVWAELAASRPLPLMSSE